MLLNCELSQSLRKSSSEHSSAFRIAELLELDNEDWLEERAALYDQDKANANCADYSPPSSLASYSYSETDASLLFASAVLFSRQSMAGSVSPTVGSSDNFSFGLRMMLSWLFDLTASGFQAFADKFTVSSILVTKALSRRAARGPVCLLLVELLC